jgi:NADH-quinone oxidoreductase subunit E
MFEFCRTACCATRGVEDLMDYACEKIGANLGDISADGMFQVVGVECLGACGYAPMLQLGDFYHEKLTKDTFDQLIEDCKAGKITLHDK